MELYQVYNNMVQFNDTIILNKQWEIRYMTDKYNGWTNYETWNIKLWIDNEEYTSDLWTVRARELLEGGEENPVYTLHNELKEWVDDNNPLIDSASMYTDLLGAAISSANFYEIAEAFIDSVKE